MANKVLVDVLLLGTRSFLFYCTMLVVPVASYTRPPNSVAPTGNPNQFPRLGALGKQACEVIEGHGFIRSGMHALKGESQASKICWSKSGKKIKVP